MASDIYYHPTHWKFKDLSGMRFGRLVALGVVARGLGANHPYLWLCDCDCGNSVATRARALITKNTQSCGCYWRECSTKHGLHKTRAYSVWACMKHRCSNKSAKHYDKYGGRGITVCERWMSFENFHNDMGDPPSKYQIDRIDNNAGYCKDNCRWATARENSNNTRWNVQITFQGETRTVAQWAAKLKMKHSTLWSRFFTQGWSIERALTTPVQKRRVK